MKNTLLGLLCFLSAAGMVAEDFEMLVESAIKNDRTLQMYRIDRDSRQIQVEKRDLDEPLKLQVYQNASDSALYYNVQQNTWGISLEPGIRITLPDPWETSLSASCALDYADSADQLLISPGIGVGQSFPLNDTTDLQDEIEAIQDKLTADGLVYQTERRKLDLERQILFAVRSIRQQQHTLRSIEREIDRARKNLELAELSGAWPVNSSQFLSLQKAVSQADENHRIADVIGENRWTDLEMLCGMSITELPEVVTPETIDLTQFELDDSYDLRRRKAQQLLRGLNRQNLDAPYRNRYQLSASYDFLDGSESDSHLIGVGGGAQFEDLQLSGTLNYNSGSEQFGFSFGVSWKQHDRRTEELSKQELDLQIARGKLEIAELENALTFQARDFELALLELEQRRLFLSQDRALADLQLNEQQERFNNGLASMEALEAARWRIESLDYTQRILAIDYLLLRNELDSACLETD